VEFDAQAPDGTIIPLGTAPLDATGTAEISESSLVPAPYTIFAVYLGDTNFNGSTSAPITLLVNPADTTVVLTSSSPTVPQGASLTLTATISVVSPGSFAVPPTGTLTFYDTFQGSTTVLSVITVNGPPGTFPPLAVGTHLLTVVYSGDSNFNGSTSAVFTQIVTP
jgi:hypothetical protein